MKQVMFLSIPTESTEKFRNLILSHYFLTESPELNHCSACDGTEFPNFAFAGNVFSRIFTRISARKCGGHVAF